MDTIVYLLMNKTVKHLFKKRERHICCCVLKHHLGPFTEDFHTLHMMENQQFYAFTMKQATNQKK